MSAVNESMALEMVKARLNRLDTTLDDYLAARISAAVEATEAAGITLEDNTADLMLIVDTAVWEYQNRDNQGGVPEWLRLRRRERWVQQKREETDDDS